jgi:type IV pilus assembly protein PilX
MYLSRTPHRRRSRVGNAPARQGGVVLLVALIILVALTLAGVALMRSVDTANLVAGNLSFHQSAIHAGERSTEATITNWLQPHNLLGDTSLHQDSNPVAVAPGITDANGYVALRQDPAIGQSWDAFWIDTLAAQALASAPDAAGNTVSYVVHRLCERRGAPHGANCAKQPASISSGGSFGAGGVSPLTNNQVYYRITTRIAGPRNTVAFIQTIVAL